MAAFRYEALDSAGHAVAGVLHAETPRQARAQLRAQGLLPSTVAPVAGNSGGRRFGASGMSTTELSLLTRQLATLLESGLTVEQCLNALIEQASDPVSKDVLAGVKAGLLEGQPLAGALGAYASSFPDYYRALVRGGEESGALPSVLMHLADYLDSREALKQKTGLALLYPALVVAVAILIVTGLLIYVVPQVVQVFQQSRQTLPLLTRALIALSDFLQAGWPYMLALFVGAAFGMRFALRRAAIRMRWDMALLRAPWLGSLVLGVNTARFSRTLAILVRGGVPLLTALGLGAEVITNVALRRAVERAIEQVREGTSLARALESTGRFPTLLVHLVASGEASGRLDRMLERAASLETQALERRLAVFVTVLEPVMILVMGGIVLAIVLAILLPVIEINQLVR